MIIYQVYIQFDFDTLQKQKRFLLSETEHQKHQIKNIKISFSNYSKYTQDFCGLIIYLAAVVFAMH